MQGYKTNDVLMQAFANEETLRKTLEIGLAHYYSRSRNVLWKKGETSGPIQELQNIMTDCDNDSILLKVKKIGAACYEGIDTCFYNKYEKGKFKIIGKKMFEPKDVYKKSR